MRDTKYVLVEREGPDGVYTTLEAVPATAPEPPEMSMPEAIAAWAELAGLRPGTFSPAEVAPFLCDAILFELARLDVERHRQPWSEEERAAWSLVLAQLGELLADVTGALLLEGRMPEAHELAPRLRAVLRSMTAIRPAP